MIEFKYIYKDAYDRVENETHIITHQDGLSEVIDDFRHFLLAIGYQPESIAGYFNETI